MVVEKTARQLASDDKQSIDGAAQLKHKHTSHHEGPSAAKAATEREKEFSHKQRKEHKK